MPHLLNLFCGSFLNFFNSFNVLHFVWKPSCNAIFKMCSDQWLVQQIETLTIKTCKSSFDDCHQGRSQEFILTEARGLMASAGARAYNGGLGVEAPAGSRGRAPGQGVRGEAPLKLNASKLRSAHRKAQIWPCLRDFSAVYTLYKKN